MALFDNGKPKEFLMFVRNLTMTLKASGTLQTGMNIQYFCTLVCGKLLHQFDALSAEVKSASPVTLESIILGLGT